jgi:ABC-type multidrug transport system permease subunit
MRNPLRGLGAVVYKERLQMRRDPASLFLALLVPVIQLTIFGFAIDTEIRDIPTVVVDRANVRASRELARAMEATGTFRIDAYLPDRDTALVRLREGRAKAAVLLPGDLESRVLRGEAAAIQLLVDGSDSNLAAQAQAAMQGLAVARGTIARPEGAVIEARVRYLYNPDGRSEAFFVPGLAGIILQLVTMTLTAAAVVRERERGTLEQLMVTPISRLALTLGKIVPSIVLGSIAAVLIYVVMVALFGVPVRGSLALLGALTALFLFTSLALGLLISTIARTQLQALMLTLLILLPSVLLSGFMFPRAAMPSPIREFTWAIPATYFVEIMRGVVLRGASAADLAYMIVPLGGIGAGLCVLVALRIRKTLA